MIDKIKMKYENFSDSWISSVEKSNGEVRLTIVCSNVQNRFKYEKIMLVFTKVDFFVHDQSLGFTDIVIIDALLKYDGEFVLFDIDPLDHFDYLEENENSKFKLRSKNISHSFIELYNDPTL